MTVAASDESARRASLQKGFHEGMRTERFGSTMLTSRPEQHMSSAIAPVLLACLAAAVLFVWHPRISVLDEDGYAYIMGARSLHEGNGYRGLTGEAFNHWPPGYSLLLSVFPNAISAAMVINYLSFGVAVGSLYYLLRHSGWTWQAAGGLSAALAAGFFRSLANIVHADIFSYALFLVAICAVTMWRQSRLLPSLAWAFLIPIKFIAVVFLPPALLADRIASIRNWRGVVRWYLPGLLACSAGIASILIFNYVTIRTWIPRSHEYTSLKMLFAGARTFLISIPREFLFGWHGSVTAPFPHIAFPACLILAAVCLISLRPAPDGKWFVVYGVLCLVCSGLLLGVRWFEPSVRLVGYGLIVLFLGFRPRRWANPIWLLYGFISLAIACVNAVTVNSLGSNDPRYAELAAQVRPYHEGAKIVATNSFHLLDLHANIPSVPVTDYGNAAPYDSFLWVTLPSFDPGASPVTTIERPGPDWCEKKKFVGGILFSRCKDAGLQAH